MAELDQALRDLFAEDAADLSSGAAGRVLTSPSTRHRRWPVLASAVTVLAVAVVVGLVAGTRVADGPDAQLDPATSAPPLGAPAPGFRWTSWRDVAVQVPAAWGYRYEPYAPCQQRQRALPPFVGLDETTHVQTTAMYRCVLPQSLDTAPGFEPYDASVWTSHLSWRRSSSDDPDDLPRDGERTHAGWTLSLRTIGDTQLRLVTPTASTELREQILATARSYDVDAAGCERESPIDGLAPPTDAFDVAAVGSVDSISVCLYAREPDALLRASRRLGTTEAGILLSAIQDAPPTGSDRDCEPSAGLALVVRLHTGEVTRDLHVTLDGDDCDGFDDGVAVRDLTAAACRPLFSRDPVRIGSGNGSVLRTCT